MDDSFLPWLRCPRCGRGLGRPAPGDRLACSTCGASYPIDREVPRFTDEGYTASFGRQWNRYDVARHEEDASTFRVKAGVEAGARVVGVDLSSAVDKARALCRDLPDVAIVQADLERLPLAERAFDFAFSIGVLHHGPHPFGAFREVARRVKPGGKLAVWLYRRNTRPQEWINSGLRAATTRMPARALEPLCAGLGLVGGVPVVRRALNKLANFSNHPDWTLRVCDNFDWYAPRYQSHHTVAELKGWFVAEGFADLVELAPARAGRFYDWAYRNDLVIGSGVNVVGTRVEPPGEAPPG